MILSDSRYLLKLRWTCALILYVLLHIIIVENAHAQSREVGMSYSLPVKSGQNQTSGYINTGLNPDLVLNDSMLILRVNRLRNLTRVKKIIFYKFKSGDFNSKRIHFKRISGLGRKKIVNNLREQEGRITNEMTRWRFDANPDSDTSARAKVYRADFERYLRGKTVNRLALVWLDLADIPVMKKGSGYEYRARIRIRKGRDVFVYNAKLPAEAYYRLPEADSGFCQPVNRLFDFKKLKGYGYENVRPLHYIPSKRKVFNKDFEVLFDRNSTQVNPEILQPIIQFLENNHYSILNASVRGYASVEGPEENNYRLQQKRAELMIRILQEHNTDEISLDTVIAAENWDMFFKQIKNTSFEYLDSISRDSLRILLKDSLLLVKLEPFLKKERKAVLDLTLADIFTPEQINTNLLDDIRNLSHYIYSPFVDNISKINLNKMAGILFTLENRVRKKLVSAGSAEETLKGIDNPVTWVMYFYLAIGQYETTGKSPELFGWKVIFRNAQYGIINLVNSLGNKPFRNMFLRMAVDVQYYAFRYIEKGFLDPGFISELQYPDEPVFYPLILNRYAYINNSTSVTGIDRPGPDAGSIHNFSLPHYFPLSRAEPQLLQDPPPALFLPELSGQWGQRPQLNVHYQSAYYYFIKKVFVYGDKDIQQYVWQSDNLYEFDLYELLRRNVENWDPVNNNFYDADIDQDAMSVLIRDLQAIDQRICSMAKNQLYLDFYLKYLYYYKLYGNPYDREQQFTIDQATRFISEYYRTRISILTPAQVLAIVKQLNLFYGLPSLQSNAYRSYQVLRDFVKSGTVPPSMIRLYILMASFYEPNMQQILAVLARNGYDVCAMTEGHYAIKPWREDIRTYYRQHCTKAGSGDLNAGK